MIEHDAIDRCCQVLASLPEGEIGRKYVLFFVAGAIDVRPEPTGLSRTPDRPIGQMYWDHSLDDLKAGMIRIVSNHHVDTEFFVEAILAWARKQLRRHIDDEQIAITIEASERLIAGMEYQKTLPIQDRKENATDAFLDRMIAIGQEMIAKIDCKRSSAMSTLGALDSLESQLLSSRYWDEWRHARIGHANP